MVWGYEADKELWQLGRVYTDGFIVDIAATNLVFATDVVVH